MDAEPGTRRKVCVGGFPANQQFKKPFMQKKHGLFPPKKNMEILYHDIVNNAIGWLRQRLIRFYRLTTVPKNGTRGFCLGCRFA